MNTTFKLPGGRMIPMQRAIAMGVVDAKGNPTTPPLDSQGEAVLRKEQRQADWAAKQAGKPAPRATQSTRKVGTGTEPEVTEDGKLVRKREPKPLKPQNVTPEGEPVTDEETLAEIAAKTAAIEAAKAAEEA